MENYSYIGTGKVYLGVVGGTTGLLEVGNCTALSFAVNEETKEIKDYTQPGGGTYNEVRRISSVEVSMTLADLSPENLARALFGTTAAVTAGAVTDEAHVAHLGAFVPLDNIPDSTVAYVVTDEAGTTTYTAGTDYEERPGGLFILPGGTITDGQTIHVNYTKAAADVVQALTNSAQEYELFFAGLNEARSGKQATIRVYRATLGAARNLGLIGDEFASLEVSGKVLADTSKPTGTSQYFQVTLEQ